MQVVFDILEGLVNVIFGIFKGAFEVFLGFPSVDHLFLALLAMCLLMTFFVALWQNFMNRFAGAP